MNVKLVVVQGKPEGKEIAVRTAKFLIGRGTECHLRPNSELISRHHCLLLSDAHGVTLRDLGSTNGTRVNGERVSGEVALCQDDLIQVGPLGFRLVLSPVAMPAVAPAAPRVARSGAAALGAKETAESDIERFLAGGGGSLPGQDSGVLDVGQRPETDTTIVRADGQDTHPEIKSPPLPADVPNRSDSDSVTLESGRKKALGNARVKIDKTREDTSRAAADILRRIVDRRSES